MTESGDQKRARLWRARPEKWWWIALVVLIPVLLLTGIAAFILIVTTHPSGAATEIDLARTALSVGGGTGGVVALVLASRRQWHVEQAQVATERDAAERRITELYGKAVEQLGSDKAAVRLGGLYALERLAQDNQSQRRTIVDVVCAYLRMPYQLPGEPPRPDATAEVLAEHRDHVQERQVRLTAQGILTRHLNHDNNHTFWPDTNLDLTTATLINFNLVDCRINEAKFHGAQFSGTAWFEGTQFSGTARFDFAQFDNGGAFFSNAKFNGTARFDFAQFDNGDASFVKAQFSRTTVFRGAQFRNAAWFDGAQFRDVAWFGGTQFRDFAQFSETQFTLGFNQPRHSERYEPCWVRRDLRGGVTQHHRVWPQGWSVVPTSERPDDATEGEWGRLLQRSPASETTAIADVESASSQQSVDE